MKQKSFNLKRSIERYDPHGVGITISLLSDQIFQVAHDFPKRIPIKKRKWNAVVVCAMGGSALGSDILRRLYKEYLSTPIIIVHGYHLPGFVNRDTLVVLITYSGTTEEVLSCIKEARKRNATTFSISSGKTLAAYCKRHSLPQYVFSTENNPSSQPRLGTGYTMTAQYMLLKKYGLLKKGHDDLIAAAQHIHVDLDKALRLAKEMQGKSCLVIAAEHLSGNAHILSNQLNESAKMFAPYYLLPELNHHLLEGLASLHSSTRHWKIFLMQSDLYNARVQKRVVVTKKVLEKQGFSVEVLKFSGSKAGQMLKALAFGSWFSYYHAIVAGRDPSTIPWVDHFKKMMR